MTISPIGASSTSSHATALQFIRGLYALKRYASQTAEPGTAIEDRPIEITKISASDLNTESILAPYYLRRISENGTRYLIRVWYA
ncbi:MAG TPA: hypothetical protein PKD60_14175 [Turneriella sp.]|nr:hypothetical protein [Turneriella sp.]